MAAIAAKRVVREASGGGAGDEVRLTPIEWGILEALVRNAGRLVSQRALLNVQIVPQLVIVVLHNGSGLVLGFVCALAFRVAERDRRAITIEGGMQNSGLALGIIAVTFNADLGMVIIASLWGIWHIVSGLTLALLWRGKDARLAH